MKFVCEMFYRESRLSKVNILAFSFFPKRKGKSICIYFVVYAVIYNVIGPNSALSVVGQYIIAITCDDNSNHLDPGIKIVPLPFMQDLTNTLILI